MIYEHRAGGALTLHSVRNLGHEMEFEQWPGGKQGKKVHHPTVKQIIDDLKKAKPK